MRRSNALFLTAMGLAVASSPLLAAPADAVRNRIDHFRELGASFKTVNDSLRTAEPQTILIQMAARQIVNASRDLPNWFPAGSGPETGEKTKTKPAVWTQAPKFKSAQTAFAAQAAAFQRAAQTGNAAIIKGEARKLGTTCKGCHDTFREPGN